MEVRRDTLAQLLDHSRQLYSLPAVALEVLELTNQPQIDTTRLKECIERDPALTTKVLRVVNSSLFGLGRRVADLNQALAVLGNKPLRMLVLGFGLPEPLFAGLARDVLNHYWRHTLTRAVAARDLSERLWNMPGDELFVAGLLADLGRLVLIQGLGRAYVEVLRKADWPREDVRALERRLIGFDHTQLTAGLIQQWGLPDSLVAAVQLPETLSEDSPADVQILYLAEKIAELLADDRPQALPSLQKAARMVPKFTERQLTAVTQSLDERVRQLSDVLSLDLSLDLPYSEVLARAYTQLAAVSSTASGELLRCAQVADRMTDFADRDEARNLSAAAARFHAASSPVAASASRRDEPMASALYAAELQTAGSTTSASRPVTDSRSSQASRLNAAEKSPRHHPEHLEHAVLPAELAIEPALRAKIVTAAANCRQRRQELTLLLVEIDLFDEIFTSRPAADWARQKVGDLCRYIETIQQSPLELGEARFAIVLAGCDRPAAADAGHLLLRQIRSSPDAGTPFTLSIGAATVAVPAKNFDPVQIVRSAERCLRAAQLSGGNGFKSIETF